MLRVKAQEGLITDIPIKTTYLTHLYESVVKSKQDIHHPQSNFYSTCDHPYLLLKSKIVTESLFSPTSLHTQRNRMHNTFRMKIFPDSNGVIACFLF